MRLLRLSESILPAFWTMDRSSTAREARRKDLFKSSSDVGTVGSCSNISCN